MKREVSVNKLRSYQIDQLLPHSCHWNFILKLSITLCAGEVQSQRLTARAGASWAAVYEPTPCCIDSLRLTLCRLGAISSFLPRDYDKSSVCPVCPWPYV